MNSKDDKRLGAGKAGAVAGAVVGAFCAWSLGSDYELLPGSAIVGAIIGAIVSSIVQSAKRGGEWWNVSFIVLNAVLGGGVVGMLAGIILGVIFGSLLELYTAWSPVAWGEAGMSLGIILGVFIGIHKSKSIRDIKAHKWAILGGLLGLFVGVVWAASVAEGGLKQWFWVMAYNTCAYESSRSELPSLCWFNQFWL